MSDAVQKPNNDRAIPERAKELAADVGREVLDRANQQGQRGMKAAGEGLERAATYVGTEGAAAVGDSPLPVKREQVEAVADRLHTAARYLETHDPESLVLDIDNAIKRHPYRAVAVGLGLGYIMGRLLRSDR